MNLRSFKELKTIAVQLAEKMKINAKKIDEEGLFPVEHLNLLKDSRFMSLLIPQQYGGEEISISELSELAQIFSSACLSTGIIWGMHCQQISLLVNSNSDYIKEKYLSKIVTNQSYLGSVTTEKNKGGHLLSSHSPLFSLNNGMIEIERNAPIVTGSTYADAYLITMKKSSVSNEGEVEILYIERNELQITVLEKWNTLGMRGTQSDNLYFKGEINPNQIVNDTIRFDKLASYSMIPVGHIVWASCWLGAVKGIFKGFIRMLRDNKKRKEFDLNSELLLDKIASIRLLISNVEIYLNHSISRYSHLLSDKIQLQSSNFNIEVNNLKILASESLTKAMHLMMDLGGLNYGYYKNSELELERTFRDITASCLMYHNDRLKQANGKLCLFDTTFLNEYTLN